MSDTPRTDAYNWDNGNYDDPLHAWGDFAAQLERELTAANRRISRLVQAGDCLLSHRNSTDYHEKVREWDKAKEAKP